ncbi:MAG TPA: hypothetical protein PLX13_13735 [Saprospiraceae bacterium]|nr:hypothetical protein [Saprospiraceae bacterium]HNG68617.1 hypothetical protein [Saprospiraceae bacterium]
MVNVSSISEKQFNNLTGLEPDDLSAPFIYGQLVVYGSQPHQQGLICKIGKQWALFEEGTEQYFTNSSKAWESLIRSILHNTQPVIRIFEEVGTIQIGDSTFPMCTDGSVDLNAGNLISDIDPQGDSAEWYEALTPANKTYIDNLINSKA